MNNIINWPRKGASCVIRKEEIITSLINDVSNLLNSKQLYAEFDEADGCIMHYGLQDLSYYSPYSKEDQKKVSKFIEHSLAKFEPRLQNVSVTSIENDDIYSMMFHFKITATFKLLHESISIMLESKIDSDLKKILLTRS